MWEALNKVESRYQELTALLSRPEVASDPRQLRDLSKERAALEPTVRGLTEYRHLQDRDRAAETAAAARP